MTRWIALAFAGVLAGPALGQGCFGAGEPLFHCTFKNGTRAVDICLQGDVGIYRYGPSEAASELLLADRVEVMFMLPWNGVGSSIYEELGFTNGDVDYTVHYAVSRIAADEPEVTGGITVTKADQKLAELTCDPGSVEVREFYPVYLAKEAKGQCWDRTAFSWGAC
ncbi:hypothetical protein [Roseovarius sp. 2305UL8-3]|uniref:hypothetical protein n=1 Tax=Roseovarius conchicola TaxID=3121636 RepID=UPI0035290B88